MQKLYCYVDETGQDVASPFFLVSVVIVEEERDQLISQLEEIERTSLKGRRKWMKSRDEQRIEYIRQVVQLPLLRDGRLTYATYPEKSAYLSKTVLTTARAITLHIRSEDYKATIFIDGLPKSQIQTVAAQLRTLNIRMKKVRGVQSEENDTLMRLADAMCGFVRSASERDKELAQLLAQAKRDGVVREL
jgi:hypothetical protein